MRLRLSKKKKVRFQFHALLLCGLQPEKQLSYCFLFLIRLSGLPLRSRNEPLPVLISKSY